MREAGVRGRRGGEGCWPVLFLLPSQLAASVLKGHSREQREDLRGRVKSPSRNIELKLVHFQMLILSQLIHDHSVDSHFSCWCRRDWKYEHLSYADAHSAMLELWDTLRVTSRTYRKQNIRSQLAKCFPPSPSALRSNSLTPSLALFLNCLLSQILDTASLGRRPLTLLMKKRPPRKRPVSLELLTSVKWLAEVQTSSTRPPWCPTHHSRLLISVSSLLRDHQPGSLPDRP